MIRRRRPLELVSLQLRIHPVGMCMVPQRAWRGVRRIHAGVILRDVARAHAKQRRVGDEDEAGEGEEEEELPRCRRE